MSSEYLCELYDGEFTGIACPCELDNNLSCVQAQEQELDNNLSRVQAQEQVQCFVPIEQYDTLDKAITSTFLNTVNGVLCLIRDVINYISNHGALLGSVAATQLYLIIPKKFNIDVESFIKAITEKLKQ